MMIHLEAFANRMKRRKFTVIDGGASRSRDRSDTDDTDDDSSHPDLQDEVDRILDKIAREGMDSLNDRERRILERASNKRRR